MNAWYFAAKDRKLRFNDNREIVVGETHTTEGTPVICKHGLHASKNPLDALLYAPGPIVYRVKLGGTIIEDCDKVVASERTYIRGGINATATLRKFARLCALDVIDLWEAPDVVRRFLKTGDPELRAAAAAYADDAVYAVYVARAAAAYDSAYAAAAAAYDSAAAAAYDSAAYAADADLREKQSMRLARMLNEAMRSLHNAQKTLNTQSAP